MESSSKSQRIVNFSAGPAVLPLPVLEEAQRDLLCLPGVGASILEISHRSRAFETIVEGTLQRLTRLLNIPANYQVLFLQGGSRLQFSMIPMNLLRGTGRSADYVLTGSWAKSAADEAHREGSVRVAWDGAAANYDRVPAADELDIDPQAAYVHLTSNETIQGIQFPGPPDVGSVPLVCDASSDFLSRPVPIQRYGVLYACAQKNAGPAGVTVVIIRQDLLERCATDLGGYLSFRIHADHKSLWNTPNTFGIYMVGLVAKWLEEEIGGLEKMYAANQRKARMLYELIDASQGFYRGHAQPDCRSWMNVTFRLPAVDLEKRFIAESTAAGLCELKGHRSVGGIRASIYNAMPQGGVASLCEFMRDFRRRCGS